MDFGNVMDSILRIQNRDVRRKFFKEMIPEILAEQIESPEQCTKSMCFRETFWRV